MKQFGNNFLNQAIDWLWPPVCLGCGFYGALVCPLCLNKINWQLGRACPICKINLGIGQGCHDNFLDDLWVLSDYDGVPALAIKNLKYHFVIELLDIVWTEKIKALTLKIPFLDRENWIIVPIPLHQRKYLVRGFNQAELIADKISIATGLKKVTDLLVRTINNKSQAGFFDLIERRRNSAGIFKVDYRLVSEYYSKKILIVDDVYTTGSTLESAVSVLRRSGFKNISALVLAISR